MRGFRETAAFSSAKIAVPDVEKRWCQMNAELLIRPSLNDHKVVADLLAPAAPGLNRPISRLVVSAQDVARRPELAEVAAKSGTPLLIDPMTVLFQGVLAADDPWVVNVPFGRCEGYSASELANPFVLDTIVMESLRFQVEHGASAIVAPYFYAERPDSPAFDASLAAISRTAKRMRADGIALPLVAVLCAQLRGFAHRAGWQSALDRFATAAIDVGPQALGLYFSPVGRGDEGYAKVLELLLAGRHLATFGVPVLAWRQGIYGPALVAAGLRGYECGMGIGEAANARGYIRQHKPRDEDGSGGFAAQGTYLSVLGRSVPPKVARVLLADRSMRGRLVCDSPRCCPRGPRACSTPVAAPTPYVHARVTSRSSRRFRTPVGAYTMSASTLRVHTCSRPKRTSFWPQQA